MPRRERKPDRMRAGRTPVFKGTRVPGTDITLSPMGLRVFLHLVLLWDDRPEGADVIEPTVRRMVNATGVQRENIYKAFNELEEKRLMRRVEVRRGTGGGTKIEVYPPEQMPPLR